jgi:hypothetical protein
VAALLLFVMPPGEARATDAGIQSIAVLLYLGLVVSVGVYILSNYAVRHLPVGRMSLLGCLTAPLGAMLSALLLGTQVSTLDIIAVGLVIFAVPLPVAGPAAISWHDVGTAPLNPTATGSPGRMPNATLSLSVMPRPRLSPGPPAVAPAW